MHHRPPDQTSRGRELYRESPSISGKGVIGPGQRRRGNLRADIGGGLETRIFRSDEARMVTVIPGAPLDARKFTLSADRSNWPSII